MTPTGNVCGHWTEYSETPPGHNTGYFWMRPDGLRFGLRMAGRYYRPGAVPIPPRPPIHPWTLQRMGVKVPAGAAHDGAMAFDYGGQMREEAKQEQLPTHLRVMQNGMEVELIDEIDGQKVAYLIQTQDFNAWDFMDKRYPFPKPDRVKKVTTNG